MSACPASAGLTQGTPGAPASCGSSSPRPVIAQVDGLHDALPVRLVQALGAAAPLRRCGRTGPSRDRPIRLLGWVGLALAFAMFFSSCPAGGTAG